MLVGSIGLASCVKNIESQSVTDVRNAKAKQIESVAKLNEATAQAEVIKANAEATIAAAQAKLLEAQAKQAEAEAALIKAQADLQAIEIEIAKVRLEEERENLKERKAYVEMQIAQYEAMIAQAQANKQRAINELEQLMVEAEIQQIELEQRLLAAEQQLMIAQQNLDAQAAQELMMAYFNYAEALRELYKTYAEIVEKEADLAKMADDINYGLNVKSQKIQKYQEMIAEAEMTIEYLQSFIPENVEDMQAAYAEATVELEEALTTESQVTKVYNTLSTEYNNLASAVKPYEQEWYASFRNFVNNHPDNKFYYTSYVKDPETGIYNDGLYFYAPEGGSMPNSFVPLWTYSQSGKVNGIGDPIIYPAEEGGVRAPKTTTIYEGFEFVPAHIYSANFEPFFDAIIASSVKAADNNKKNYEDNQYKKDKECVADRIDYYTGQVAAMKEYVAKADEEIVPAKNAWDLAKEAYNQANTNWTEASRAYNDYLRSQTQSPSAAAQTEATKLNALVKATENVLVGVEEVNTTGTKVEFLEEKVKAETDNVFLADSTEAAKRVAYKAAEALVTDEIKKALDDAQKAVSDQEKVIAGKKTAEETALAEYRAAVIAFTLDPTSTAKETEMKEKKTAYETAQTATQTEIGKLPALQQALTTAQKNFDNVNNPAEAAKDAWNAAEKAQNEAKTALNKTKDELGDDTKGAILAYNTAVANLGKEDDPTTGTTLMAKYNKAKEEYEQAHQANPDDSSEYTAKYAALQEASRIKEAAKTAMTDAETDYNNAKGKYVNYDEYSRQIDPENEYYKTAKDATDYGLTNYPKVPFQYLARLAWYEAYAPVVESDFEKYKAAQDKTVSDLEEEIAKVRAKLAEYDGMEADYLAYGDELVKAKLLLQEVDMKKVDAENATTEARTAYNIIKGFVEGVFYIGLDPISQNPEAQFTLSQLEDLIYFYQTGIRGGYQYAYGIAYWNKQIDQLLTDIDKYYVDGTLNYKAYEELGAEIEALYAKIDVYTDLVELYEKQIEALTNPVDVD